MSRTTYREDRVMAHIMLHDATSGASWQYDTEPQGRTVARLYAIQHPNATVRLTVDGSVVWERVPAPANHYNASAMD